MEVTPCTFINCPQNGGWGEWANWGGCAPNCKDGQRSREKRCDNPPPLYGGYYCLGSAAKDVGKCDHLPPCPINGGVGNWEPWQPCSLTCGNGRQERHRLCNNPPPQYGGANCAQPLVEAIDCKVIDCPVPTTIATTTTATSNASAVPVATAAPVVVGSK